MKQLEAQEILAVTGAGTEDNAAKCEDGYLVGNFGLEPSDVDQYITVVVYTSKGPIGSKAQEWLGSLSNTSAVQVIDNALDA